MSKARRATSHGGRRRRERRHERRRYRRLAADDTILSGPMLTSAVDAILKWARLDRKHDIPYLAGYSRDGRTIYIDKDLPKSFVTRGGKRVTVDRYLILHEAVEKSLLDDLGLIYQHAHQIALRAEQAAVKAAGVPWGEYDRFMRSTLRRRTTRSTACRPTWTSSRIATSTT